MDLYTLLIAQSLGESNTQISTSGQRPPLAETSLPAIDFSLLADVRRKQAEEARGDRRFVPSTAIRAAA